MHLKNMLFKSHLVLPGLIWRYFSNLVFFFLLLVSRMESNGRCSSNTLMFHVNC